MTSKPSAKRRPSPPPNRPRRSPPKRTRRRRRRRQVHDEAGGEGHGRATTTRTTADKKAEEPKRPKAHVAAKTKVFGERDKDSEVSFTAAPSDVLYPGETKGDWTKVESDDGDEGWVLSDQLQVEGGSGGGASRGRAIAINVGVGGGYLTQGMNTVGTTKAAGADQVPDVYDIKTSTATLSLGGSYYQGFGAKYLIGADAGFNYSKTPGGGVTYMKQVTGLTISDFTLRGAIGYPTSRPSGLTLIARLGFRYRGYLVDDYKTPGKNLAKIPQETLAAPTIGFGIALPKLTDKLGLQFGLDAIVFGASITQTGGLEDGATPTMTNLNFNAGLIYAWKPTMNLVFAYDLDHGSYDFGTPNMGAAAMSTRGHTGTDVTRSDTLHSLSVAIAKGF